MAPLYVIDVVLIEIVLESLEDGLLRAGIAFEIVAVLEPCEGFFLVAAERFGNVNADVYDQIADALSITLYSRQAFAPEAKCLSGLSSAFDFHFQLVAFDGRNLHFAAKCCGGEVEQQIIDKVIAIADEGVVRVFLYIYLYVTIYAVVLSRIAFAGNVDHHTFGNTCRNVDFNNLLAFLDTAAATLMALVLYHLAFAAARRAYALGLYHAEKALGGMCHYA